MKDNGHHEDNVLNDQTNAVVQLPERFLTDKKPGLEQSDVRLQQITDLNPQLNLDVFQLDPNAFLSFSTCIWDQIVFQLKTLIKMHVIITINKNLNLSGSTQICRHDDFLSWINSIEGATNKKTL